jgi:hypothetical protein
MTSVRLMMAGSYSLIGVVSGCFLAARFRVSRCTGTSGKLVSIPAAWTAHDAAVKLSRAWRDGIIPWRIIGHRVFDAKKVPLQDLALVDGHVSRR